MPFRQHTDFDSETLQLMTAAYDTVVARLNIKPEDPRTSKLATLIVQLVKAGVRDSERLGPSARRIAVTSALARTTMATSLPAVWPLGRQAFFIASARTLERNNGSFIAVVEYVVRHMNSSDKYRKLAADCDARAARIAKRPAVRNGAILRAPTGDWRSRRIATSTLMFGTRPLQQRLQTRAQGESSGGRRSRSFSAKSRHA
jgi:hypothetical protein